MQHEPLIGHNAVSSRLDAVYLVGSWSRGNAIAMQLVFTYRHFLMRMETWFASADHDSKKLLDQL